MADCGLPRPLLEAWLDGECSVEERNRVEAHLPSCGVCRDAVDRAALGVGLFILNDAPPGKAGLRPSEGFTARVMARIAADPARSEGVDDDAPPADLPAPQARGVDDDAPPAAAQSRGVDDDAPPAPPATRGTSSRGTSSRGVDDDAPAASPPAAPPKGRLLRLPRPAWAGIAAAAAAAAAWVWLASDPGTTVPGPGPGPVVDVSRGSVAARDGGILRWSGAFDGALAGSVWVAKDAAVPTSAGELLHSPVPSSFSARMPEGGRLEAGPSTWLAVGRPGEAALSDGAVTAYAGSGRSLTIETPAGLVTVPAGGEAEISSRAPEGGGSRDGGSSWLGSWAAARRDGVDPGRPLPPPPPAVQVVFARKGPVEVASGGPVRNSLERKFTLREGQALVVLEKKTFLAEGVDDDGPPDSSRWMDGMPVPPGSRFFRRPAGETAGGPPKGFEASGPVRNSLERTLGSPRSEPEERAYALSVYESVGGAEAVAAAAGAVDDPAVEVRCAALRVLALNASADRAAALPALRRLAQDGDAFVARFAILALKTLRDVEAIPVLKAIAIDDDAPPEGIVAKVYALDALVALGDNSLLREGAALLPEAEKDPVLGRVLGQFVTDALAKMERAEIRAWYDDPRPGVKASALRALQDFDLAEQALSSDSAEVRLAGAQVLLSSKHPASIEKVGRVEWTDAQACAVILNDVKPTLSSNPTMTIPTWLEIMAKRCMADPIVSSEAITACIQVLERAGHTTSLRNALSSTPPLTVIAAIRSSRFGHPPKEMAGLLESESQEIRLAALRAMNYYTGIAGTPEDVAEAARLALAFVPNGREQTSHWASCLAGMHRLSPTPATHDALVGLLRSPNPDDRVIGAIYIPLLGDPEFVLSELGRLMGDESRTVAEKAALHFLLESVNGSLKDTSIAGLYPSPSPFPFVRVCVAAAAMIDGLDGAVEQFYDEINRSGSRTRLAALQALSRTGRKMPHLSPSLLSDPDPAVRIRAIAAATPPFSESDLAEACVDPNLWVQACAWSGLQMSGVASASSRLDEVLRIISSLPGFAPELVSGLIGQSVGYENMVHAAAFQSIQENSIGDAFDRDSAASAAQVTRLATDGQALSLAASLRRQQTEEERVALLQKLGATRCLLSFRVIGSYLGPDSGTSTGAIRAAADGLSSLMGFTPSACTVRYHHARLHGYLTSQDILVSQE